MSRPLRSTPTPASRSFTATTSRSASERRNRYSVPSVSASARSLSRPTGHAARAASFAARLLTFRARAADQAHAASTPGAAWPAARAAAKLITRAKLTLAFDAISTLTTPQQRTPARTSGQALLERLPGPHLTRSSRAVSLSLTTTVFSQRSTGRFDAYPRRADAGGPTSLHLSHSTTFRSFTYIVLLLRS